MAAPLLPDEQIVLDAFTAQLGPLDHWYDGSFSLRPAGDERSIRLESALIHEVARLRTAGGAAIVRAVLAAFRACRESVRVRLSGARTLRAAQFADVDLLELRIDDAPWTPVGEIRAA